VDSLAAPATVTDTITASAATPSPTETPITLISSSHLCATQLRRFWLNPLEQDYFWINNGSAGLCWLQQPRMTLRTLVIQTVFDLGEQDQEPETHEYNFT